jgi:hypothetical protein
MVMNLTDYFSVQIVKWHPNLDVQASLVIHGLVTENGVFLGFSLFIRGL